LMGELSPYLYFHKYYRTNKTQPQPSPLRKGGV
ncbi:MAG: hypothetical protein ACI85E_001966, partial [Marinomonas primoryensis]